MTNNRKKDIEIFLIGPVTNGQVAVLYHEHRWRSCRG